VDRPTTDSQPDSLGLRGRVRTTTPVEIGPLSAAQVEEVYAYLIRTDFYSEQYCSDWNEEPYRLMANIVADALELRADSNVIDIGCGAGFLVSHLARRGVVALNSATPGAGRATSAT
jgi:protein-L-isoaspartate O-methyltransferase